MEVVGDHTGPHGPLLGFDWIFWFVCFVFVFCLFRAEPMAYGGSQARGPIRTIATRATAMQDPSHAFNLHHSSGQRQILNLLSEARD